MRDDKKWRFNWYNNNITGKFTFNLDLGGKVLLGRQVRRAPSEMVGLARK